jgi:hypothetical protein
MLPMKVIGKNFLPETESTYSEIALMQRHCLRTRISWEQLQIFKKKSELVKSMIIDLAPTFFQ